ncbi:RNA-directed DNA polymerase, eukaryota, reverse transcriptase zinc-binding domain protein [Tanacetum coccineum]
MCAITETQLRKKFVNPVCNELFGTWPWVSNTVDSSKGCRIAVGWDPFVLSARLISQIDQVMHFEVSFLHNQMKVFVSYIYGENTVKGRRLLWKNLVDHKALAGNSPWVLLGDFNVSRTFEECSNSFRARDKGMMDFNECVQELELEDVTSYGMFYTWIEKRKNPEFGILKKLDRVMGNAIFVNDFDRSFANFLPYMTSDHCPAILVFPDVHNPKPKSFRFLNFLAEKDTFLPIVKENWNVDVKGFSMFVLAKRLKNMKKYMRRLNKSNGNVFEKAKFLKTELKRVQQSLNKDPHNAVLREEEMIYSKAYSDAVLDEERLMKQKAKIEWLRERDNNTAYFHKILKGRVSKSRIEVINDDAGNTFYGDDIPAQFVEHFKKFLGADDVVFPIQDCEGLFTKKLNPQIANHMIRPIPDEEIKASMFSIKDDKVAGPDGFTSKFFKKAWSIVGPDVCRAVREFFTSGKLLGELNTNLISLVPKLKTPRKLSDYRPIACCNVVYKCISKVLTNRLKEGLDGLVDVNQCAFIPGRHISDNILITQELMFGYSWKVGARKCAFKVDIKKAYDTVNWEFLRAVLVQFGIHDTMINWIMVCLTTASFSLYVNGEIHGFFKSKRGLRQGDPISPYLFTLIMEVLNLMIKRHISIDKRFRYHYGCKKLGLTHLCFADDLLLLCHGDPISACILRRGMDEFSMSSGLYPSLEKSTAFFSDMPIDIKEQISLALPFKEGSLPVRYLGVPMMSKKLRNEDCRVLIDNVKKRIFDWRNKYLSYAGKLQLISSVLSSLNVYWASMFVLPNHICSSIDKIFKDFLWSSDEGRKGFSSIAWKDVCRPKSQGGLGLRTTKMMNESLMIKYLWNLVSRKESLWVKWVNSYRLKGRCVWNLTVTKNTAWCWKSIMKLRDKIRDFVGIRVGNGRDCFIWFDKWHSNGPLSKIITHNLLSSYDIDVTDKLVDWIDNGKWTWPNEWFRRFNDVINIPVPILNELNDKAIWFNKKYEVMDFSVKEACNVLRTDMPSVMWYKHVWYTQCIPRHAFILWLAFKGRLKTQDRLSRWFNFDNCFCPLCKSCVFNLRLMINHKLIAWRGILAGNQTISYHDVSNIWAEVISGVCIKKPSNSIWSVIQRLVLGASVYFIWQERNVRLFNSKYRSVDVVFNIIVNSVRLKLLSLNLKWSRDVGIGSKVWHLPNLGLQGNNLFVDNMVIDDRFA